MGNYNRTHWVNNVTVVDAQKLNNLENEVFLLSRGGETNSDRLAEVEEKIDNKLDQVSTEESSEGTIVKFYANKNLKEQIVVKGGSSVHVSTQEPASKDAVWVDTDDEDVDANLKESEILTEFQNKFHTMQESIDKIDYALKYKIDSGYFKDIEPGTNPGENTVPEGTPEGLKPRPEGTVNAITVKRGYKRDLEPLMEGEFGFCLDTEELYIGNKGMPRLIGRVGGLGGSGGGGGNLTGKFLELESEYGKKFRINVDEDGYLHVWDAAVDTALPPDVSEANKFDGLVIRSVYGGGAKDTNKTVCSHGFIELYNNSKYVFNLKGLSIQYAANNEEWQCLPLRGIIKPYCSFLIRCAQHTDINKPGLRYKIENYDMHWDVALSDKSIKTYLCIGTSPCKYPNPFDINNGGGMKAPGYINMFSVGGVTVAPNGAVSNDFPIDAYEKSFRYVIDKNTMAYRLDAREWKDPTTGRTNKNFCFADTGDNFADIWGMDLRTADPKLYTPKCSKDGVWNTYWNKLQLDLIPMCINIGYGEDGHTSRTFSWQTLPLEKGFVKYRKKGTYDWTIQKADAKTITHPETNATVHSTIVHGLSNGIYEYQVGSEGRWSDIAEFEVKSPGDEDAINFIQTGDQQGWIEKEYTVWGIVLDEINKKHQYDFMINVGDISQNGGARAYEWRYYYDQAPILRNICHMTTCGNNDLTYDEVEDKKIDPIAFTWYTCVENAPFISCYSWNYGYIHFVCINSNVLKPEIATEQIEWLRKDMAKPENQKRWTIVYMHEAPYTHTRSKRLEPFINPFAELGVDLVLCGHHHRYSRSKRMGAMGPNKENRESPTGFYCVMGQAAGFKLSGKTKAAENNHEYMALYDDTKVPCYIYWKVTHDRIEMESYKVHNIVPFETNVGKTPEVEKFDTLTITKN